MCNKASVLVIAALFLGSPLVTLAQTPGLIAAKYTGFSNQTMVAGVANTKLGSFTLSAGSAENININTIAINLSVTEATAITNLRIVDAATGTQLGSTKVSPVGSANEEGDNIFSVSYTIPAGNIKTIDLIGTIKSSASAGAFIATLDDSTGGAGVISAQPVTIGSDVVLQTITIGSGSLSARVSSADPLSSTLIPGSSLNPVGKFEFIARNTNYFVQELKVKIPRDGVQSVSSVSLRYKTQSGVGETRTAYLVVPAGSQTQATATFTGLNFYIPKDTQQSVDVLVDIPSVAEGAIIGKVVHASIDSNEGFRAVDTASGLSLTSFGPGDLVSNGRHIIGGNSTPGGNPQSIQVTAPSSGAAYAYGELITVSWVIPSNLPVGSRACITLQENVTSGKEFAFPDEGSCSEVENLGDQLQIKSISDSFVRTPGYDIAPGTYQAIVRIVGAGEPNGKDGPILAIGESAPFRLYEKVQDTGSGVSCSIRANKTAVKPGETYTLSWMTKNITNPVMNQIVKAGGLVEIAPSGSMKWTASTGKEPFTETFQIVDGGISAGRSNALCSVSVRVIVESVTKPTITVKSPNARHSLRNANTIVTTWSVKNMPRGAGTYVELVDSNGRVHKSQKVNGNGTVASIDVQKNCNGSFSDAIDGGCTGLRKAIEDGNTSFYVRVNVYTPSNACFGYCSPDAADATILASANSETFTIKSIKPIPTLRRQSSVLPEGNFANIFTAIQAFLGGNR